MVFGGLLDGLKYEYSAESGFERNNDSNLCRTFLVNFYCVNIVRDVLDVLRGRKSTDHMIDRIFVIVEHKVQ